MRSLFISSCQTLGCKGNITVVYEKLQRQYCSPTRHYHTFDGHVRSCIKEFTRLPKTITHRDELALALFFHDAIMDFTASDNEERSADFASQLLKSIEMPEDARNTIMQLILTTKHTAIPSTETDNYMIDIDLAIFGQSPAIFDLYEQNIRKEYAFVAEEEFRFRRAAILRQFLDRSSIYSSKEFAERYEKTARENLCRSIAKLQ